MSPSPPPRRDVDTLSPATVRLLLRPRSQQLRNALFRGERRTLYLGLILGGGLFWLGLLGLMLWGADYAWSFAGVGPLLMRKLLDMLLSSLFVLLTFSNVIAALSVFYLSDDLELTLSLPVSRPTFHHARAADTLVQSSWMMLLFGVPVFLAYGIVAGAGPSFFLLTLVAVGALLVMASNVGVALATVLVNVYPARRTRELMVLLGAIMLVSLFVLLRTLRPERLVDAQNFESLAAYLAELQLPSPVLFPPRWASEVMGAALTGSPTPWVELGLLLTGALASLALARWTTAWGYDGGWARAQEARAARFYRSPIFDRVVRVLPPTWRPIAAKELRVLVRDPAQWSQIFLLAGLCAIYLVSVWFLPTGSFRGQVGQVLRDGLAFLNLGMGGFVMSAIAGRFQFTALSREGKSWWVLRGAPVVPETVLRAKAAFGLVPMVVVGEVLVVGTGIVLQARWEVVVAESILTVLLAFGISGIATAMGAIWPDFSAENAARGASSPAAVFFMVVAQGLVALVLALFVVATYLLVKGWTVPALSCASVAVLSCGFAGYWPPGRAASILWSRGLS